MTYVAFQSLPFCNHSENSVSCKDQDISLLQRILVADLGLITKELEWPSGTFNMECDGNFQCLAATNVSLFFLFAPKYFLIRQCRVFDFSGCLLKNGAT